MKKLSVLVLFFVCVFSGFSLPRGLTNKPIEQFMSYWNNPVPQGFERVNRNSYMKYGKVEEGLLLQIGLAVLDNTVRGITYIWQSDDYRKIVSLRGELFDLLDQYNFGEPVIENSSMISWIYNGYTINITGIGQEGRTYDCSIQFFK